MGSRIRHRQSRLRQYAIPVLPGTPAILMTLESSGSNGYDDENYSVNEVTVTIFETNTELLRLSFDWLVASLLLSIVNNELGTNLEVSIEVGAAAVEGATGLHLKVPRFCRAFKGAGHEWGIES